MSAHHIHENAPLGSLIRYFDGAPQPPLRFSKKLSAWKERNGIGRLVKKEPPRSYATFMSPAGFMLHEGDFATDTGVVAVIIMRGHSVTSALSFLIEKRPPIGSVRILHDYGGNTELLHLAANQEAAEAWLSKNRYSNARFELVTADEHAANIIEGRAA